VPTLPLNSTNGVSGTWSPTVINNQTSESYLFTPNSGQCATSFTLNVTISAEINPIFTIATTFCQNATVPTLPLNSTNGVSGTWSPTVINNQNDGSYLFTPTSGQCADTFTLNVTITPEIIPTFSIATTFCQNATVPTLPLNSTNGVSGIWSPAVINNQNDGSYLFTPNSGQCADTFTLNVTITPEIIPTFSIATTFCQNATVPTLPLNSTNGVSGTWSPTVINNQTSESYLFTPNIGQCATNFILNVIIETENVIVEEKFLCLDELENAVTPLILNSGLSAALFTFVWFENGLQISQNTATITVFEVGSYEVVATPISTGCQQKFVFQVLSIEPIDASFTVSADFQPNQTITVNVQGGSGDYLYSFEGLPFQLNSTYSPIDGGDIVVVVKDANGCYQLSKTITIWNYPRFFTPNGDGFNDTWGIKTQQQIAIDIFDRYGKLLRQLRSGNFWDGTFDSQFLPATDYWFVLYYAQNKVFKSHFSLKR
jgi:gliding motility-associated-like protein